MPKTDRKLRVFICHSSADKPIAREIYQRLNAEGWIDPWLDEIKLLPGQDWKFEIEKAVKDADALIVCVSKNSVSKEEYVGKELSYVLDIALEKPTGTIFIIPLRLDDCPLPHRLLSYLHVDYFPIPQMEPGYDRLVKSLRSRTIFLSPDANFGKYAQKNSGLAGNNTTDAPPPWLKKRPKDK